MSKVINTQITDLKKKNKSLKKEMEKQNSRYLELRMERDIMKRDMSNLKKELKIFKHKSQSYKDEVDMLYRVIDDLNAEINELQNNQI